jgi:hypothetical protein
VTEYDLSEFKKVLALVNVNISSEEIKAGKNLDRSYVDIVTKANIARRNGITLTAEEKSNLWFSISAKSGEPTNINDFCKRNKVSKKFLESFLEDLLLWQKHLNENLKRLVAGEVDEGLILDYMEYNGVGTEKTAYDLTKISLGYVDSKQQAKVMSILNKVYNRFRDKKSNFKLENFKNTGPEKLVAISETELNSTIVKNLKNVAVGDATRPFCTAGVERGTCFIFMVDRKELTHGVNEYKKMNVTEMVFSRILENKIEEVLEDYSKEVKISYYH